MHAQGFDRLARALAAGTDRRRLLGGLFAAGLPTGLAALTGGRAAAQAGTPPASPAPNWLYVLDFESAMLAPDPAEPDQSVLTVAGVRQAVLAFADHPDRRVQALPSSAFVTAVADTEADPLHATLEAPLTGDNQALAVGERTLVAVELMSVERDATAGTVTYRVRPLAEGGPVRAAVPLAAPAGEQAFGPGHLFVDSGCRSDCLPTACGCTCDPGYVCPVTPDPTEFAQVASAEASGDG